MADGCRVTHDGSAHRPDLAVHNGIRTQFNLAQHGHDIAAYVAINVRVTQHGDHVTIDRPGDVIVAQHRHDILGYVPCHVGGCQHGDDAVGLFAGWQLLVLPDAYMVVFRSTESHATHMHAMHLHMHGARDIRTARVTVSDRNGDVARVRCAQEGSEDECPEDHFFGGFHKFISAVRSAVM